MPSVAILLCMLALTGTDCLAAPQGRDGPEQTAGDDKLQTLETIMDEKIGEISESVNRLDKQVANMTDKIKDLEKHVEEEGVMTMAIHHPEEGRAVGNEAVLAIRHPEEETAVGNEAVLAIRHPEEERAVGNGAGGEERAAGAKTNHIRERRMLTAQKKRKAKRRKKMDLVTPARNDAVLHPETFSRCGDTAGARRDRKGVPGEVVGVGGPVRGVVTMEGNKVVGICDSSV
uniref:Uncharacterized protein n=1 Tax=Branchiostoma floridae TaxID=7739 RepID=C3Z4V4_BRAFL|eukprot:XP_002596299.1 hypothetical protein BRAFLDRAFT_82098 [Branchiostoma floridae]